MIEHAIKLYYKAEEDRLIFGDAFVEFGDRSLLVIDRVIKLDTDDPKKIEKFRKKVEKYNKIYGYSPIIPKTKKYINYNKLK